MRKKKIKSILLSVIKILLLPFIGGVMMLYKIGKDDSIRDYIQSKSKTFNDYMIFQILLPILVSITLVVNGIVLGWVFNLLY